MEHTKGPWTADETTVKVGRLTVAQAYDPENCLRTTDMGKANARLIAAAPNMLEALEAFVDAIDSASFGIARDKAMAAIINAKSEE